MAMNEQHPWGSLALRTWLPSEVCEEIEAIQRYMRETFFGFDFQPWEQRVMYPAIIWCARELWRLRQGKGEARSSENSARADVASSPEGGSGT